MTQKWRCFFILTVVTFALYFQTLFFDLTYLDDNVWILDYQIFFKHWSNVLHFFTQPDFLSDVFYRPVLNLSFLIDAQLYHFKPWGYHLTNIILHAINSYLVFLILDKISANRRLSFLLSLIFCVHPVHVSAVAWIPGRTDTLLAVFVLSSFLFFLNKKYVWHAVFFILALLTKETAIVLPGVCLIYGLVVSSQWSVVGKKESKGLLFIWLIILSLWFFIRHQILGGAGTDVVLLFSSFIKNLPIVISYSGKAILPVNLSVLPHLEDMTMVWGWLAIILTGVMIGVGTGLKPVPTKLLFGLFWFLLFLLPSLVLSFLAHEYRLYVPMVGFLMIVGTSFKPVPMKWYSVLIVTIFIFSIVTFQNSQNYRNRMTFWQSAVHTSPTLPLAQRNLGAMYFLDENYSDATTHFLEALRINPNEKMVHNNLGLIAMNQGNYRRAEEEYVKEIQINPQWDNVYFNFGILRMRQGKIVEATNLLSEALRLNPINHRAQELIEHLRKL